MLGRGFGMPIGFGFSDPMAAIFREDARLSPNALSLMKLKSPAWAAQPEAAASAADATSSAMQQAQAQQAQVQRVAGLGNSGLGLAGARRPKASMRETFEAAVAQDTALNEFTHHARVHAWLSREALDFKTLNARLYSKVFLTPRADPWLGLAPEDAFSALDNDGVTIISNAPALRPVLGNEIGF